MSASPAIFEVERRHLNICLGKRYTYLGEELISLHFVLAFRVYDLRILT